MKTDKRIVTGLERRDFLRLAGFGTAVLMVGGAPFSVARAGTPGAYTFALRGDGKVAVIDQTAETVIKTIDTGGKGGTLGSLSMDGSKLFVANNAGGQRVVSVIDTKSMGLLKNVETGASPKHPVLSPDGKLVALNHTGLDEGKLHIAFLDAATGDLVRLVQLPVTNADHKGPFSMHGSWSPDGSLFAIGSYADSRAWFIRRGDFSFVGVDVGGNAHYFDWFGKQAWVTVEFAKPKGAESACQIAVIDCSDPMAPKSAASMSASRAPSENENLARIEGHHGVFTNDGSKFVVCNRGDAPFEGVSVEIIDRASGKKLAHIASPAKGVGHAYLSPDGKYALITLYGDTKLPLLDLASMQIVKTLDAGSGEHLGHATFTADGKKAFVSNRKADEVMVVDMTTLDIKKRIATGSAGQAQGQVVNTAYNVFERITNANLG